jgi:DnaJ-class molecular chaperone
MKAKIYFVFFVLAMSCSQTKTIYVSCTDQDCPYCLGRGIRSDCHTCKAKGVNRDLASGNYGMDCEKCEGYGVIRCGYYVEVDRKK